MDREINLSFVSEEEKNKVEKSKVNYVLVLA